MKPKLGVYHSLPVGGARRSAFEHASRLIRNFEVSYFNIGDLDSGVLDIADIATSSLSLPFSRSRELKSPFGRLNSIIRILDLFRLQALSKNLSSTINHSGSRAILAHTCMYCQTPLLLQYLTIPSVYYCHEHNRILHEKTTRVEQKRADFRKTMDQIDPFRHYYHSWLSKMEKKGLFSATKVLVNSRFSQTMLLKTYGVSSSVCYNGVDCSGFRNLGLSKDHHVLSIGAIAPIKGFDYIIEELGLIAQSRRPALVIVGFSAQGEELRYLREMARNWDVKVDIRFAVSHEELIELYNRAIITIYTPHNEPFGLVPLESMACGTPVIGVREGGIPETILDHQTGILINRGRGELARAVVNLLDDEHLCQEMGKTGREYVKKEWNWDKAIQQLTMHLNQVI